MMLQNLMLMGTFAKMKLRKFFSEEKGAVTIVEIVVLVGIAVLLALVFKDQITSLLESLFKTIIPNADKAVGGGTSE